MADTLKETAMSKIEDIKKMIAGSKPVADYYNLFDAPIEEPLRDPGRKEILGKFWFKCH